MADAMVFPSQYEGFGAPLIEAMALGCPVIASDSTCIPEVLDGAGLVLPLLTDAWSGALDVVRRDRTTMIAAGLRRAESFTARAPVPRWLPLRGRIGGIVTDARLRIAVLCPHFAPDTLRRGS